MEHSSAELTRGYKQPDVILHDLAAAITAVWFLEPDAQLAILLLTATGVWQDAHQRGKAHPMGACGTVVAVALLKAMVGNLWGKG